MKKMISFIIALVICLSLLMMAGCDTTPSDDNVDTDGNRTVAYTVYVASNGNDESGDGSESAPFATIGKAKEFVKTLSKKNGDIVVELADGFYKLDETLNFNEDDSGNANCTVIYRAADGAKPIISGGSILDGEWVVADDVNWLKDGLVAYKTPLTRDAKLRAIYVDGVRAAMTRKTSTPKLAVGMYSITQGQADWAWVSSSAELKTANIFDGSFGLPANTRNPQNIELESGSTWVKATICAESLEETSSGDTKVNFQMPYAAIAQNLGWNCNYNPTGSNDVINVFEWLEKEGQFYFDQAGSMLYYIPREGEDINEAEVIIPELEKLVEIRGSTPLKDYAQHITFDGLTFAYSDWNLYELDGSHGNATTQGCTIYTKFSDIFWHNDLYRAFDVAPAAVHVNTAHDVHFINGGFESTGYLGIHLENDVYDCNVEGNFVGYTGGSGIVVGHLQHIYENDTEKQKVHETSAGPEREKFKKGTEAVPKNITIKNNYLLENCYFFPGNSPITTFFTYNLTVEHNFVYKCSYSGMSIGWGWCNFDGTDGSQLPGQPTTTSRFNHVNYNRIEEICSVLQDAGGIYTLGQQGNEDWSEMTEMTYNYINCFRKPTVANGSRMVNGFHPDEGSAFILFDHNVVTNTIRNVYELNDWMRKHDCTVTNGFSNNNRSETTAPNCTLEQYVNEDYIWPVEGYNVVLYSGLEDEYVHMVGKDVMPDDYYELASNVAITCGEELNRRGLLSANDTVWLAPAGTTEFEESFEMTKAAGDEKTITIPAAPGEYKLYIVYADGTVSDESTFTVYAGERKAVANVSNGRVYNVSDAMPIVLELETQDYTYTLNGESISDGHIITTDGDWELVATSKTSDEVETVLFKTEVLAANRLLTGPVTVKPGEDVMFATSLNEPDFVIWLAPSGLSAFNENDPTQSKTSGDSESIKAPEAEGVYILTVVDGEGNILSQSDTKVTVLDIDIPIDGLSMWFSADSGITLADDGESVLAWETKAGNGTIVTAESADLAPKLSVNENGAPALLFDGVDDMLYFNGVDYNGLSEMTMFVVTDYDGASVADPEGDWTSGDKYCAFYISEVGDWGSIFMSPYNDWSSARFGTGEMFCNVKYVRPEIIDTTTVTAAVKSGTTEMMFVGGEKVVTIEGRPEATRNGGTELFIGRSKSDVDLCYFKGTMSDIIIYTRALTDEEVMAVSDYLASKNQLASSHAEAYAEEPAETPAE